jgi:hypothetical protein
MSGCTIRFDPRSLASLLHTLEITERSTFISVLTYMWSNEGHVEANEQILARRCGMRPSRFRKSFGILIADGLFDIIDGRVYPALAVERMMLRSSISPKQRAAVLREEDRCAYCLAEEGPFDVDHIFPAARGGTNHRRNLTLACVRCNSAKRMLTPSEWGALNE